MRAVNATVQSYMTPAPYTIDAEETLRRAHELLLKYHVRYLPVLRGERVVGLLCQRDLALLERARALDIDTTRVADAMSTEVYRASVMTSLDVVAGEMADRRYCATLVFDGEHVVGILTAIDICLALADVLRRAAA